MKTAGAIQRITTAAVPVRKSPADKTSAESSITTLPAIPRTAAYKSAAFQTRRVFRYLPLAHLAAVIRATTVCME